MIKLLAAIVASTFALIPAAGFAAGTMKLEDLTREQRMDMRSRADQLTAERAANPNFNQMQVKKPHAAKAKAAAGS